MNRLVYLLIFVVLFQSCSFFANKTELPLKDSTLSIDQLVEGWPAMIEEIKAHATQIPKLNNRKYNLRVVLEGTWNLNITPINAFRIERGSRENLFTVTIVNPYVLFDNLGGLSKMTYVQAELSKAGGEQGAIELSSKVECLYRVRFYQDNGHQVDFNQISTAYDYDFIITPHASLSIHSMTPTAVIFSRTHNNSQDASVQVRLVSKNKKEVYLSNQVKVPSCFADQLQGQESQSAQLCVRHLQTLGEKLDSTRELAQPMKEVFGNTCQRDIRCQMQARYGLLKEDKFVHATDKTYDFIVKGQGFVEVDTGHTYPEKIDFDSKLYLGSYLTKAAVPKNYEPAQFQPLSCSWAAQN